MSFTRNAHKEVLPNGLTVVAQRYPAAPVVAVVTHVRAGYFDEPDEWVGIAHVLEHMYFKGTARRGPGAIAREIHTAGGAINAGTIYDKTVYHTVLPSAGDGLARALDVHADALMHAALDTNELRRELEVIIQEANRKLDSPEAVATETLYALLFRVHRMRRWRIGTEAGLRRLTPDDVRRYYLSRYTPDRVIVALVGDLDPDDALRRAAATLGAWHRPAAPISGSPPEPEGVVAALKVLRGDVQRPLARLGWRTVGALHRDAAALDVAAAVLGAGRGSRLYRTVELPGLAHSVEADHYTPTEVGVLEVGLRGEIGELDAAVRTALATVEGVARAGPSDDEVARVKALTRTFWARRMEAVDGRATALAEAEALGGYELLDRFYEQTLAVTAEDVRRVAAEYLQPERAAGVVYLRRAWTSSLEGAWPPAAPPRAAAPLAVGVIERRGGVRDVELVTTVDGVEVWQSAGAELLIRPRPGSGLVTLGLHFADVPAAETAQQAGISWLAARAALRGAGDLDSEALALAAERLGGGIVPSVGAETMGWWMTVAAGHVGQAAALLERVALEPTLATDALAIERLKQIGDARSARDDMFRHPVQQVLGQAFPGDAYGLPAAGTPESVAALDDDAVRRWLHDLRARRAVVVVVGDVESHAARQAVAGLAAWPGADGLGAATRPAWGAGRAHETRDKKQSALAMAFAAPSAQSSDRYPLAVLAALLGGMAGRLFQELRERRSLAYTVTAMPWLARRAGAVVTYIATAPAREAEARDTLLAELQRMVREPPTTDELDRARNYTAGMVDVRRQRGIAVAAELLDAWVLGRLDELPLAAARLRAVSAEDVRRVASEVFDVERRAEYVVRGTGA